MQKISATRELDRNSYKPLYIQLSEILIDYASANDLKHGDALLSENQLLSKFSVSRNTIRLAVDRLVKMGFATKVRGQGTFLRKDQEFRTIGYHHAFEGSMLRLGITVTNKLIDMRSVPSRINWMEGLGALNWDESVLIRRLKLASEELLAFEERLLPAHAIQRYSHQELENENINPDLLTKYPDTQTRRFKYFFLCLPLSSEESDLLKMPSEARFLCRIGEYFNALDERFMLSRLTIVSERINLGYNIEERNNCWVLTS